MANIEPSGPPGRLLGACLGRTRRADVAGDVPKCGAGATPRAETQGRACSAVPARRATRRRSIAFG